VQLDALDLADGAPVTAIDPYDESLTGNVTDRFAPRQIGF
jgi:tRNA (Thr-GGU) A37 N-methylase